MTTTIVWPRMYCGVPKKRAACSARRPKASVPNVPWCSMCSGRADTPAQARRGDGQLGALQELRREGVAVTRAEAGPQPGAVAADDGVERAAVGLVEAAPA